MTWTPLDESAGLWTADYRVPNFGCRTTALRLADGRFLLHSPGRSLAEGFADAFGEPAFLLAPSSFHHMGIHAWKERYPNAVAVCGRGAKTRLEKQGHSDLVRIDDVAPHMPAHATLVQPPGTRAGEVWIRAEAGGGVIWVVCDAIFNLDELPSTWWLKAFMKMVKAGPGLATSGLYKFGGVKDRPAYKEWVLAQLRADRPHTVVMNHGNILKGDDVADRLIALTEARF